jgi:hypothetical protein
MHGIANVRIEFTSTSSYAFMAWKGITLPLPLTLGEGVGRKRTVKLVNINLRGERTWCLLNRKVGGPQSQTGALEWREIKP